MLLLPFYSFESLESNPYDHCSTRSDFFMRFVGHTGFDLMNVSCRLVLWILLMKPGCLGESFLRCQFAGIHGRGWVSLCIVNGWEGEVVDVTALTNSIQSGCNYQYATATHLSITSLLTHSTRYFCAFCRQLPQIEVYSASSRTVDSQFTGLHPPFLLMAGWPYAWRLQSIWGGGNFRKLGGWKGVQT